MPAPESVLKLVEHFERNLDAYKSGHYNETQLRLQFLDPLFKALGWDMHNEQGYAEAYKDVIHEDALRIGEEVKAPDYCFRIGGTRKFFLEAKKPSVFIKEDIAPAYQLRRYAWSAKLPLSILSDFEEFAVYDCRIKPDKADKASLGRIFYCTFREYAEKWDYLASLFSKDAVLKGSFDKFAETNKAKRGTAEVDADFLATIEGWRKKLAQNLALRNAKLSQRELNFAVQRIIDRIIFLRIAEDRGIEDYGRLRGLVNGDRVYPRLCQLFEAADARYNSGLFHFKKETGRNEAPDELTLDLEIDDKLLRDILRSLYYPDSPYAFGVLSADILGQVYEQFLGKIITLTDGHRADVVDKPEVKKAGGVYYTPTYIVDYIVRQTVGKLVEGRTPKQVEKLKILDPACGSGSFLIGAYQFLLDWHLQYYLANDPGKWAKEVSAAKGSKAKHPVLVQSKSGAWQLSIAERKRILLNNVFGVDIDSQAVEVTKLSLLLKVLEGEIGQAQLSLGLGDRVLPDLGDNIKCGNSLIGPDFYQQSELPLLTDEERYRINVFDWHAEFPEIFRRASSTGELRETAATLDYTMPGVPLHGSYSYKIKKSKRTAPLPAPMDSEWEGGFDAVIGNPPYLGGREWKEENGRQYDYFVQRFEVAEYQFDIYALFIERAIKLTAKGGSVGFITPNTWLNNQSNTKLRSFLLRESSIVEIADYSRVKVFRNAIVLPIITILKRGAKAGTIIAISKPDGTRAKLSHQVRQKLWDDGGLSIFNIDLREDEAQLREKIANNGTALEAFADVKFGIKLYETGKGSPPQKASDAENHIFEATRRIDSSYRRYLEGKDIESYRTKWVGRWLKYGQNLAAPRDSNLFTGDRLVFRRIVGKRLIGTLLSDDYVTSQLLQIVKPFAELSGRYLLGILNSRLTAFFFRKKYNRQDKTFPEIRIYELASLPIRALKLSEKAGKTSHDRMVSLVETMLELHPKLAAAKTPQEQTALERQIAATDAQIDRLVYDLYGLTEDEIKIVEHI